MNYTDEDAAFDFAAMVEESEKYMQQMCSDLPEKVCATVEKTLAKSARVEALERASGTTVRAAATLLASIKKCSLFAMVLFLIIPVTMTVFSYMQIRSLIRDKTKLEEHIGGLAALAEELKRDAGGLELARYSDGKRGVILPIGAEYSHHGRTSDGREAIIFVMPE